MKKLNLWLLLSLFVAAFTLTACGSDDDDETPANTNALSGTWKWIPQHDGADVSEVNYLTFGNDNSFKQTQELYANNHLHVRWIYVGTYAIQDGNKVTINIEKCYGQNADDPEPWDAGGAESFTITYRIDGNKLYYTRYQGSEEGPYVKQ